jgi:hypothetical protein
MHCLLGTGALSALRRPHPASSCNRMVECWRQTAGMGWSASSQNTARRQNSNSEAHKPPFPEPHWKTPKFQLEGLFADLVGPAKANNPSLISVLPFSLLSFPNNSRHTEPFPAAHLALLWHAFPVFDVVFAIASRNKTDPLQHARNAVERFAYSAVSGCSVPYENGSAGNPQGEHTGKTRKNQPFVRSHILPFNMYFGRIIIYRHHYTAKIQNPSLV